jgi:hypothetical protein
LRCVHVHDHGSELEGDLWMQRNDQKMGSKGYLGV